MTDISDRVEGFLKTWGKRQSGELSCPDLSVNCALCGLKITGDDKAQFTRRGLVCTACLEKMKHGADVLK